MTHAELVKRLLAEQDLKYRDFHASLLPNIDKKSIIGVRVPTMRKITKEFAASSAAAKTVPADVAKFLDKLPHKYFEENQVHLFAVERIKDFDECLRRIEQFLPYIDNWAVNDGVNPACFKKHRAELIGLVQKWISSEATYTRRCGMKILMANYLDDDFKPEYLDLPADLRSNEYYVNMMTAWLFAEALVKQWDSAVIFIETHRLDSWTHNKAIQKACESFRVPDERKEYLRTLRCIS